MRVVEGRATVEDVDAFVREVQAVGEDHDATVQAFDARYVVDRAHLERAVDLARRARERDTAIATDPAVEILLYAAGRRQIQQATTMGVSAGDCPVVAVAVGPDEASAAADLRALVEPAETLGGYDPALVRDFFDIGERELAATDGTLSDLVRERVALLVVER